MAHNHLFLTKDLHQLNQPLLLRLVEQQTYHFQDALDISNLGTYQIQVGGVCFPQLSLNAGHNKSAILQELRKAIGALYGTKNSMSINSLEYAYTDVDHGTTTYQPAKFYIGFD